MAYAKFSRVFGIPNFISVSFAWLNFLHSLALCDEIRYSKLKSQCHCAVSVE